MRIYFYESSVVLWEGFHFAHRSYTFEKASDFRVNIYFWS